MFQFASLSLLIRAQKRHIYEQYFTPAECGVTSSVTSKHTCWRNCRLRSKMTSALFVALEGAGQLNIYFRLEGGSNLSRFGRALPYFGYF